jgi:hypothetical protein
MIDIMCEFSFHLFSRSDTFVTLSIKCLHQISETHKNSFVEFDGFFGYLEYKYCVNHAPISAELLLLLANVYYHKLLRYFRTSSEDFLYFFRIFLYFFISLSLSCEWAMLRIFFIILAVFSP